MWALACDLHIACGSEFFYKWQNSLPTPLLKASMLGARRQAVAAAAEAWGAIATRGAASRAGKTGRPRPAPSRAPPPPAAAEAADAAGQPPAEQQQAGQLVAQQEEWTEVTHPGTGQVCSLRAE